MNKNILGLDIGTTSIGFAHIIENDTDASKSEIKQIGVRIIQYDNFDKVDKTGQVSESKKPEEDFAAGRGLSPNASRTIKRGARRRLDRYQDRRSNLINALSNANIINKETKLAEIGKASTFSTIEARAKAATEKIEKDELARVLLAINKKRGYKSSRRAKSAEEGQAIDGMGIAKRLYEDNLTPGQLSLQLLNEGKKNIPDFYRSDLLGEFEKVWNTQKIFYPEIFTDEFKKEINGKGQKATSALFWNKYQFNTAENKAKTREEKKMQAYSWRSEGVNSRLTKEEAAFVITEINNNLNNSSGYLGAISDRSKELYFNKVTIGQYLYKQIKKNPHTKLKNQVFYRQDYMDEFEAIWNEQSKYYPELTEAFKIEMRDIIIFYQRKLKSQKGLISICEFESRDIEIETNGQKVKKTVGLRVAPKSSSLFQEFKIWQRLNDLEVRKKGSNKRKIKKTENQISLFEEESDVFIFTQESKEYLFEELNLKGNLPASKIKELMGLKAEDYEINFSELEGNRTNLEFYNAYLKILEFEGYDENLFKLSEKDDINVSELKTPASEIKKMVREIFESLGIDTNVLEFDAELEGKAFEQQSSYQLWHLLYSAEDDSKKYNEDDNLVYGNENIGLKKLICQKFGFKPEHAKILANITFQNDYGNLSSKALRKLYPYLRENNYSTACELAGYNHSSRSLTREELANRELKDNLELLKKNSLRNPVVEKILNQVVNVVNSLIEKNSTKDENGKTINYYRFDEIRIELARELKKNAKERAEMTDNINETKIKHEKLIKILISEFSIKNPTRNDIIRLKLYEELKNNGYKDLYTNTYIAREILFSKQIDIEHIIPQSKLFDDSFSNKTVVFRKDNLDKGNQTAIDYIERKFSDKGLLEYQKRIENLFEQGKKNKEEGINKAKYQKLLKREMEIGDGFIERDLRDSQYIAKKAKDILFSITRSVVSTTGSITNRLREDWDLINVMQELNFSKFKKLGLTEKVEKKDGTFKERIVDWSKRNDHRHHAMDALTVAFTRHNHIQYLNYLNARKNEKHKEHNNILAIEEKETYLLTDENGRRKRKFKLPIPNFRHLAKEHLEGVLVSHKAKNKVVTKNKNKITGKEKTQITLTPRGQLHKETVYGKYKYYDQSEEKINSKFDEITIAKVANPAHKKLLLQRLADNGNDPARAFSGKNAINKNPIYLNSEKTKQIPEKVKLVWLEENYSIRKDITPDNFKDEKTILKVLDKAIKDILLDRLKKHKGDHKKAFSDLDKNPIWLNEAKGIAIKRVTISGVKNAEPLHFKKNHLGQGILTEDGKPIPVDFVSTGNNHHVAIYRDEKGNLQERVVSLFEAVQLVNAGEPVIDKYYNQGLGWQFLFTMKQNEYFVFPNGKTGFNPKEIDLLNPTNKKLISPNSFRVQSLSIVKYGNNTIRDFKFRHHLETTVEDKKELIGISYQQIKSLLPLENIVKVHLNHLGEIVKVGEF